MVRIQEILEDGTLGPAIEAMGLSEAEATVVLFNPGLAPEIGLAAAAEWLWNRYGDRITDYVRRQAAKEIDRMKREARLWVDKLTHDKSQLGQPVDSGRPRKQSQGRIDFPKTKANRNTRRIQGGPGPDPDDELIDDMKEAENPPPADSMTAIPEMGKWTSYPTTHMCVDLGTMNLNPKGGKYGDYISPDFVVGTWTKARNMYEWLAVSNTNGRQYQILTEVGTFTLQTTDHIGASLQQDDQTTPTVQKAWAEPSFNAAYRNCSFNSALTINEILHNLPIDAAGDSPVVQIPSPSGADYTNRWAETSGAFQMFGIRNQFIELHIKNMSGSVFSLSENTEQAASETALKMSVYVIMAKEDLLLPSAAADSVNSPYNNDLAAGFTQVNDRSRSEDPLKPSVNNDQNYNIYYSDNGYLNEKWSVVDKKEFCLCPGQEGTMRIGLPKNQVLSLQYLLSSQKGQLQSGTVGTNALFRYKVAYIKKGEQHVLVDFHGGIGLGKSTTLEGANFKPVSAAFLWNHSYEYCVLTNEVNQEVIKTTSNTKTAYTDYADDINTHNAST